MAVAQPISRPVTRHQKRRQSRVLPLLAALVVVLGAIVWGWVHTHPASNLASQLVTAPVTRGDLTETVSATGSVTAQTGAEVKIGSQITGRIKRLYADVGSHVKAGELIAQLDLPDIQAQLDQAKSNLAAARTKLVQEETGVPLTRTQNAAALSQSRAALNGAQASLAAGQAAVRQQTAQTTTDIQRAKTGVVAAQAALATAKSTQAQVQAGANLQIATAQEQLKQAQANATNSAAALQREVQLNKQGFVPNSDVDQARATDAVNQSQVQAGQHNVELVQQKVTADLQSGHDGVTQAQQNLDAAQAALAAAQAEIYQNAAKESNVQDLRAQVRQSQANLQTAQANLTNDVLKQQDVEQAQEAVRTSQAQVDYAQAQVDKTYIRSPISGTVLQLAAQQGETLAAGLSAPTLIVVADLNRLQVDAYVDETDIGKAQIGQQASVTVDAYPQTVFKGHVTKIAAGSTIQQGVVTYDVSISVQDPKHLLRPDMTANVTIQTGTSSDVLLVPSEAVKIGVQGSTVNVLTQKNGNQAVVARKVQTGGSDGVNTEVLSGLREGETVVLAGLASGPSRPRAASPFGPSSQKGR